MAVTKVKLFMGNGDRLELQKLDTDGFTALPLLVIENGEITEVWTDATPSTRIAAVVRMAMNFWVSDQVTLTNA